MAYQGISPEVYKNIRYNVQLLDDIAVADLLNLDEGTLKLDPTNNRIGINNANPTKTLDVGGDTQVADLYYTADYPTIRPTLDLAFDKVKRLDSRVTFTRTSTATYVDENGIIQTAAANEPRFDHDPITGESLGLLIEESRTNLVTSSADLISSWTINETTTSSNLGVSPDNSLTADSIIPTITSNVVHRIYRLFTVSTSINYTFSFFIKPFGYNKVFLRIGGQNNSPLVVWNTSTKTIDFTAGTFISSSIQEYPNGWYRVSLTMNTNTSAHAPNIGAVSDSFTTNSVNEVIFTGDGNSGAYVWGAQLEQGSFPTSYIPTSESTVTRSAEFASITGTNFSNIYNASEGTLYLEAIGKGAGNSGSNATFQVDDGTSNNRISVINDNETVVSSLITISGSQTNFTFSPSFTTEFNKNVIAYKSGDIATSLNGSTVVTNTSITTLPTVNSFRLASNGSGTSNNTIRRLTYYPRRLNNSQLQNITL
jgi:hypothetical protein